MGIHWLRATVGNDAPFFVASLVLN
jgi:hypothetical protein